MKKKGFTLVELLAVIIILAVIALIATPLVLNVVDSAKKSAWESSAYGIIEAVKMNSMDEMLEGKSMEAVYDFPTDEVDIQGEQPKGGQASVNKKGKVAIAIHNEKWCALKDYDDAEITLVDYDGECTLGMEVTTPGNDDEYTEGTLLNIQVGTEVAHDFYVLKDNGDTVTLILNDNLGDTVAWGVTGDTAPTVAETYLNNYVKTTENWNNVSTGNVKLPNASDILGQTEWYQGLSDEQKANWEEEYQSGVDLIVASEAWQNCTDKTTCQAAFKEAGYEDAILPDWLLTNIDNDNPGYWLSELVTDTPTSAYYVDVFKVGVLNWSTLTNASAGVRPVITIDKSYINK